MMDSKFFKNNFKTVVTTTIKFNYFIRFFSQNKMVKMGRVSLIYTILYSGGVYIIVLKWFLGFLSYNIIENSCRKIIYSFIYTYNDYKVSKISNILTIPESNFFYSIITIHSSSSADDIVDRLLVLLLQYSYFRR